MRLRDESPPFSTPIYDVCMAYGWAPITISDYQASGAMLLRVARLAQQMTKKVKAPADKLEWRVRTAVGFAEAASQLHNHLRDPKWRPPLKQACDMMAQIEKDSPGTRAALTATAVINRHLGVIWERNPHEGLELPPTVKFARKS